MMHGQTKIKFIIIRQRALLRHILGQSVRI